MVGWLAFFFCLSFSSLILGILLDGLAWFLFFFLFSCVVDVGRKKKKKSYR